MNEMNMKSLMICMAAMIVTQVACSEEIRYVAYPGSSHPSSASACRDLNTDWPSPFTNAVCWSDGLQPHKGATYIAGKIDGADSTLWTPIQSVDTTYDMFDTLVLESGCILCIRHTHKKAAIFNDLRIAGDTSIWLPNNGGTTVIGGKLTVQDGVQLILASYNSRLFRVDSDISGGGNIRLASQGGTSAFKAIFALYGANTDFLGKIQVRSSFKPPTFDNCTTLYITNAIGLGGNLPEFKYDALNLTRMSRLVANASDIVLPASANRGISIGANNGRFDVPVADRTFTVNWPITLGAYTLYKDGPGHLVLGQPLRFTSVAEGTSDSAADSKENPISGKTHSVDVREGTVSVTDCNALNGAKIAFSNETAFVMSVDLPDGGMKTYGVRCDKALYAPLATTMPIRLRASTGAGLSEGRYVVSLVTVPNTYAADVESKLSIEELPARYRLLGITSAAAEGLSDATTFKAEIVRRGMTFCLR